MKIIKEFFLPVLISICLLEAFFWILGTPPGGSTFVEGLVMKQHLSSNKPRNEIRVFTYGESTMVGAHYSPVSNPAVWLEKYLQDFLPEKNLKVVNWARMGRGSAFTLDTFEESLAYKPDYAIFYMGHNEFLPEERMDETEAVSEPFKYFARKFFLKSRLVAFFYRIVTRIQIQKRASRIQDKMGFDEIETPASELRMADATPRNQPFFQANIQQFRWRIEKIQAEAKKQGIPVLFIEPVCNLKDFRPMQSMHLEVLSSEQLAAWQSAYDQGKVLQNQKRTADALVFFKQAYAIDPTYADLLYDLGRIFFERGDMNQADFYFKKARDFDCVVARAPQDILDMYQRLVRERHLEYVEIESVLRSEVPGGILGEPIIEDNVHFSIKGHQLVARKIAEAMAERGWIAPGSKWHFDRERSYESMVQELGVDKALRVKSLVRVAGYLRNRSEDRIRNARKAYELDPTNTEALRSLAWAYWIFGQKASARKVYSELKRADAALYEKVLNKNPDLKTFLGEE